MWLCANLGNFNDMSGRGRHSPQSSKDFVFHFEAQRIIRDSRLPLSAFHDFNACRFKIDHLAKTLVGDRPLGWCLIIAATNNNLVQLSHVMARLRQPRPSPLQFSSRRLGRTFSPDHCDI